MQQPEPAAPQLGTKTAGAPLVPVGSDGIEADPRLMWNESLLLLALSILLFSTLDAIFTLALIETGYVEEWNPILAALIERDPQLFAGAKAVVTHGGVFVLVAFVHRRLFGRIPVRRILEVVFGIYLLVIIYHLVLTYLVT